MHPRAQFARLIRSIQPTSTELERAKSHRQTIRRRLGKSFNVARIEPIGSHARGTAISRLSDVDLLAVLRRNEAKWGDRMVSSATVLRRVRDDLDSRYSATTVRGDQQAAVVNFASGRERLDVVPALFSRFDDKNQPIYGIPDGNGRWLATSPAAHNRWLRRAHAKSGGKLFKTAQLLKYWKHMRASTAALGSFYLELWLARNELCIGARSYGEILADAFDLLARQRADPILDPLEISGWISATKTAAQLASAISSVASAADHADRALAAERRGNHMEATRQWNIVFNGRFH